jgi:hypothetical protein
LALLRKELWTRPLYPPNCLKGVNLLKKRRRINRGSETELKMPKNDVFGTRTEVRKGAKALFVGRGRAARATTTCGDSAYKFMVMNAMYVGEKEGILAALVY